MDGSTPIWQLTVDQIKELIQSIIPVPAQTPEIKEDPYLTSKECQEYLKISSTTLHRWRKAKYLKSEKFGGIVRFKKSDCDKVLGINS